MLAAKLWRENLCVDWEKKWIMVKLGTKPWKIWAGAGKKLVTAVDIATKRMLMDHYLLLVLVTLIAVLRTIA